MKKMKNLFKYRICTDKTGRTPHLGGIPPSPMEEVQKIRKRGRKEARRENKWSKPVFKLVLITC
jgi:hypothetical protein